MSSSGVTNDTPKASPSTEVQISHSGGLQNFLKSQNISLAFTSYQTGFLYLFGPGQGDQMALHQAQYPRAMGITSHGNSLYLATHTQVVRLENVLAPGQQANEKHDKVYVPRNFQTIGAVDLHEIGVQESGRVLFVNTRYSCLCEPSLTHSFKPVWKPSFISKLVPEDRCHLNELCLVDGKPKYVSAACRSDVVDGWRDRRHDGGIIIDVETDEIIADGLSMPHSPRWYRDQIWIANSGSGEIGWIDSKTHKFVPLAFCPGFVRPSCVIAGLVPVIHPSTRRASQNEKSLTA